MERIVYIMTVGTGTAGRTSNLESGLARTIALRNPEITYLVPSANENSRLMADLVCERLSAATVRIVEGCFTDPDDLLRSRRELRGQFARIAAEHPDAHLIVNPTSGTKQMTTAAVLAAVDLGIADIEYITGPREDGVVVTGKEEIRAIPPRCLVGYRAAADGRRLLAAGAYQAAGMLLEPYADLFPESLAACRTLGAWHRFAYREALRAARGESLAPLRRTLASLADARNLSLERAADMLAFVDRSLDFGQVEEALAVLYRLAETMAGLRLRELGVEMEPMTLSTVESAIFPPQRLTARLRACAEEGTGILRPGLALMLDLLVSTGDSVAEVLRERRTWELLQLRHETRYGHGTAFVAPELVCELRKRIRTAATRQWSDFDCLVRNCRFPDVTNLFEKEMNHV